MEEQILNTLDRIEKYMMLSAKEVLNTKEVALMLNIQPGRVRALVSARDIPYYKNRGKTYFKKSEIENWLLSQRIPTNDEMMSKAALRTAFK